MLRSRVIPLPRRTQSVKPVLFGGINVIIEQVILSSLPPHLSLERMGQTVGFFTGVSLELIAKGERRNAKRIGFCGQ
jgi:hypothetical protein